MFMRHRYGQQMIVRVVVDSATEIEAGDLLFLDTDDAKPAAAEPWDTNVTATRINFRRHFLGIAQADHLAGSGVVLDFPVDISPLSVYEMNCEEEHHEIGDPLTVAATAALSSKLLVKTNSRLSIARCVRRDPTAKSRVMVRFQSAYWGHNDGA